MVYSRYVEKWGPYLYRSERQGKKVLSIYMGPGSRPVRSQKGESYTTLEKFKDLEPEPAFLGPAQDVKPKKERLKLEHKTKAETGLTYMERYHLTALAKKYNIDRAEIDHHLSYDENKEYLESLARQNSYSEDDIRKKDLEAEKWAGSYSEFLEDAKENSDKWSDYFVS